MKRRIVLMLVAASFAATALAQGKSLYWRSLEVTARLDSEGRLHVSEQHTMVFTGDWNGGERTFNRGPEGKLQLDRLVRIDAGGAEHPLVHGDLDQVDHFGWSGDALRWRSRLPSDPPFDKTPLTYRIDYTMWNILLGQGSKKYLLSHDFAFANREGVIQSYSLHLEIDPAWRTRLSTIEIERSGMPPGSSVPLLVDLEFTGAGKPLAVPFGAPFWFRWASIGALLGGLGLLFMRFVGEEKEKGRLAPVSTAGIDQEWLETNIFSMAPEVVGAAWDERTSASEVAAVLARLTQEGKIESQVDREGIFKKQVLKLRLKVDRSQLKDYEKSLVSALFFSGDTTDTDRIRKHYKSTGFDPASKIESGLKKALERIPRWNAGKRKFPAGRVLSWFGVAVLLMVATMIIANRDIALVTSTLIVGIVVGTVGSIVAGLNRNAVTAVRVRMGAMLITIVPLGLLVLHYAWPDPHARIGGLTLVALIAFALAVAQLVFEVGRSDNNPEKIAFRRRLATARAYFLEQLRLRSPLLRDEWFPYLLAFGLGSHIDRWFRAFGSAAAASSALSQSTSYSSTSGSGSSPSGWTGGGGAFGGAGASGTWAMAAGALASGVSAPSSSSSGGGGGGGGGGSSSGGGGGGGW